MEKEIALLREVLSNLFQEELTIPTQNAFQLSSLRKDRSELMRQLSMQRKVRLSTTRQLEAHLFAQKEHKKRPLEDLLPFGNENSSEVLNLHEQMTALVKKMNLQKLRNQLLSQQVHYCPLPKAVFAKKKTALATYQKKPLS